MTRLISPFASDTALNPEQGGTGVNADELESGQTLVADGEDGWRVVDGVYTLAQSGNAVVHTGTVEKTVLATIPVPGNSIGANGSVAIEVLLSYTNSTGTRTIYIEFGGTSMSTMVRPIGAAGPLHNVTTVRNRNAHNSQISFGNAPTSGSAAQAGASGYGVGGVTTTATVDTAQDFDITLSIEMSDATDTVTLEAYTIVVRPSA